MLHEVSWAVLSNIRFTQETDKCSPNTFTKKSLALSSAGIFPKPQDWEGRKVYIYLVFYIVLFSVARSSQWLRSINLNIKK